MKNTARFRVLNVGMVMVITCALLWTSSCATRGQTGALTGAGIGALAGGLVNQRGSWGATALLGAGIGAGVGYLIGNEQDKKEAQQRQAVREDETRPLGGTAWQLVSITPRPERSFKSSVTSFRTDGTAVTTMTNVDGRVEKETEYYRIVGSTLIINKPDYVVNAKFRIDGDRLVIDTEAESVVMQRIR